MIYYRKTLSNSGPKLTAVQHKLSESEIQAFKNNLLKYCAKDTLALVDLVRFIYTQPI